MPQQKMVYQKITLINEISVLVQALISGELRAVCNVSFDVGYGLAGWCIDEGGTIIRGVNIVPLSSDALDPTRCELVCIYTVLQIIECISSYYNIETGSIEIGREDEGGLKRALLRTKISTLNYVNRSHIDLINNINTVPNNSKFEVVGRHDVSMHYADYCMHEELDCGGNATWTWSYWPKHKCMRNGKEILKTQIWGYQHMEIFAVIVNQIKITGTYI